MTEDQVKALISEALEKVAEKLQSPRMPWDRDDADAVDGYFAALGQVEQALDGVATSFARSQTSEQSHPASKNR